MDFDITEIKVGTVVLPPVLKSMAANWLKKNLFSEQLSDPANLIFPLVQSAVGANAKAIKFKDLSLSEGKLVLNFWLIMN